MNIVENRINKVLFGYFEIKYYLEKNINNILEIGCGTGMFIK
tara:strand:+ start:183 stop:308 length:126 start_codon:yes stop_codon:yes gene_type:complete